MDSINLVWSFLALLAAVAAIFGFMIVKREIKKRRMEKEQDHDLYTMW